ncbi:unnamed protein product [Nippostrongylus brasiliensis]|uniref:Uncharacterized protein n=1 Tax=Nippostrongylus brasiliensis TaxID=27835 RepID=A0A0N4XZX3_NIPBR|nr:unnamed protein product [Nippostrongylus brasiliensis]
MTILTRSRKHQPPTSDEIPVSDHHGFPNGKALGSRKHEESMAAINATSTKIMENVCVFSEEIVTNKRIDKQAKQKRRRLDNSMIVDAKRPDIRWWTTTRTAGIDSPSDAWGCTRQI